MWLVWLLLAVFAAEWLLLTASIKKVSNEKLPLAVSVVVIATIVGGWTAVYVRVQRRGR